jgi:TRAP-type mannitol/chloroaromatic compound transport system substrate-binding protein
VAAGPDTYSGHDRIIHLRKQEKNMAINRRDFIGGAATGAAVGVVGTYLVMNKDKGSASKKVEAPMVSRAKTITLKVQAAWGGGAFLDDAKNYVKRVNEMAGKDLRIDLLSVNSVVKTSQMQDAVHRGVLDGAHYVPAYWYSKSPAASLFGTGPCFGWSAQEMLGWIHFGGGKELFDELMGKLGLNLVSFFNSPMPAQPLGWFKEEIKSSKQLKGLKYRTVGLAADVLNEMGMSVVQLPGGEIQPAMKSGLIDAAEFNNPSSDKDFGMQDVSKHYHLASFHQSQECFEVTFNKKKFDSLPKELQKILEYASEAENSNFYWEMTLRYANDLIKLKEKHGVNVYRTPDSVMLEQLKAWDVVIDRISKADPFFAKVVASQKTYAKKVMNYLLLNQPDYGIAYKHYFG